MTLSTMNGLPQAEFADAVGWVCEHSPWVAERAWHARPFQSVDHLHSALIQQLEQASRQEQLALLCAHPDLGTRATISAASTGEQSGAGLNQLTPAEHRRLISLNDAYRRRFGFPFLFAVKGSGKSVILENLERRLNSNPEDEFREALRQAGWIARFRLDGFIQGSAT